MFIRKSTTIAGLILCFSLAVQPILAAEPETELINYTSAYWVHSYNGSIDATGRFVAFHSSRNDLVPGDTNSARDVFLHDRQTGITKRISVNSSGLQGNDHSFYPTISSDGRYVVFNSLASNLVDGDLNGKGDVFVYDTQKEQTNLVSVSTTGEQGNVGSGSYPSAISTDGNIIAFHSSSNNLVANDTNNKADIFVRDRHAGETTRVNLDSLGNQSDRDCYFYAMSSDGRYVTFSSYASTLVAGGTSTYSDVYVHDRQTGETSIVSIGPSGFSGNSDSGRPAISANGRFIVFYSLADNLINGDTNGRSDIFRYDREADILERISVDSMGEQTDGPTSGGAAWSSISKKGEYIAFESTAVNLVENDPNGSNEDIFIKNMVSGKVTRVNFVSTLLNPGIELRGISENGNFILFSSYIENPLPVDNSWKWAGFFIHGPLLKPETDIINFIPAIPWLILATP